MDNLFNQDNGDETNPVEALVGEGKKFATVEDMARGKLQSDNYIEELRAKVSELENTNSKMDQLLEAVKSREATSRPADQEPAQGSAEGKEQTSTFNPEDIEALVSQKLEEKTIKEQRNINSRQTQEALQSAFGEKAREVVETKMRELGMTSEQVTELAATNPLVFKSVFIPSGPQSEPKRFEGTHTVPATSTTSGKGWSHFAKIRKESPHEFYSPAVQEAFNAAADAMGDDFFKT